MSRQPARRPDRRPGRVALAVLVATAALPAVGQGMGAGEAGAGSGGGAAAATAAAGPATAGAPAGRAGFTVAPYAQASVTATDNVDLDATGRRSELITTLSPGLRIASRSGRVQGSLDAQLSAVLYANGRRDDSLQTRLAGLATAEVIEQHVFVEVRGAVSQQAVSAFEAPGTDPALGDNRSELTTLEVAPSLRGRLFGEVDATLRASAGLENNDSSVVGDRRFESLALRLAGAVGDRLGWSVDASRSESHPENGLDSRFERVAGTLTVTPDVDWQLRFTAGADRSSVVISERAQGWRESWGAGVRWTPSPRTTLDARFDRRWFGDGHAVSLQHRMARSILRFTDSRDTSAGTGSTDQPVTLFDLLFEQFASQEPDPLRREALVRAFLLSIGLPGDTVVAPGFLTNTVSLARVQSASAVWLGLRTTVTLSLNRSDTSRLDRRAGVEGDFSLVDRVRQRGLALGATHRLTPTSSLTLLASHQRTEASGGFEGTRLSSVSATWSERFGPSVSGSLGVRRAEAEGRSPYTENAVTATVAVRF
jgi:uncharacterized protein (PEP-CTERM system associated)